MERQLDELGRVLVEKLGTFNVQCELGGRTTGPMVTQFEVIPAPGVKVNRIANLDADLALAMKASSVRIVAPIPGKGAVGVEIPNPRAEIVNLREILETSAFRNAKGELPLALGKDLNGRPYVANLAKMPHVLIAGATGSGKSVCLNTIVTSLAYKHTPKTLRLLMIDPKMVELSVYSRLPHLRHNVVTDPKDAAGVLKWAVLEMERRYGLLKANHVRSIAEFNRKVTGGQVVRRAEAMGTEGDEDRWIYTDGVMPYVVVVVDELADLMMTVQSEVEKPLTQLAQKARAIGIHLIVATQRPSVNVITGLIKANFPTRMAFRVASKTDSRTILDQNGADALLGNGDMLFLPPGESEPVRVQGAFLPTEDTEQLMAWYRELQERHEEPEETIVDASAQERDILEEVRSHELVEAAEAVEAISGDWDELFRAAAEVCIQNGGGSTSLLQRRLSIGYGRAARIVDQLQDSGVLGPSDGSKGRELLMTYDELEAFLGGGGS
jgi:S-DNA-T family DNA segregation ATPase FtsK/SpoIIIE